ncbi:MAG: transketolase [Phycisphaerae bacterium]
MTAGDTLTVGEVRVCTSSSVHAKAIELGKHVLRMTTAAGSGHPSSALALSHIVVELMYRQMRYDPSAPWAPGSDRLVLSCGHAVPIVYAAYADVGGVVGTSQADSHRLTIDELATLRQRTSLLDGHPNPAEGFRFFDAATGSLGQGLSVAAGLALAARMDKIDKRIFVILGDGEAREGQVWEAADFIVDHKLHNVCAVFSCNGHGQASEVSPQQSVSALAAKAEAFGWRAVTVDGHDPDELSTAFRGITHSDRPVALIARTVKGWGVPSMIGRNYHGKTIPAGGLDAALAELDATAAAVGAKGALDAPTPTFAGAAGGAERHRASARVQEDGNSSPARAVTLPPFEQALARVGLAHVLQERKLATRKAFGVALVALGDADGRIVSLDGDVSNSTFSCLFANEHPSRFFECRIAEQNMISAGVGLAAGGKIPFVSSFGKFIARATDQIDMAAITRANLKIVGSHAGVSLAADGPSQMAVSDIAYFRSLTHVDGTSTGAGNAVCHLFHPSDAISAYACCGLIANLDGLCYLRTHRPDAPFLYRLDERFDLRACKQLRRGDHLTLVSSGFMLHTALQAAAVLAESGLTCNLFDAYTLPLDPGPIFGAARSAGGAILAIEDNYRGGLHAELAEAAAQTDDLRVFGLTPSRVPKSALSAAEVFSLVGVGLDDIARTATELAGR